MTLVAICLVIPQVNACVYLARYGPVIKAAARTLQRNYSVILVYGSSFESFHFNLLHFGSLHSLLL